jgi:hypothetical protein
LIVVEENPTRLQKLFPYLAAGYFVILTVFMTWPLVTRMSNQMVGQVGDNIYFVWMIGWFRKALFELHVDPFNVWFLNYPEGWNLAYTEITPAQLMLAVPVSLFAGPTFAYNAAHILSFIFSGFIMSLWIRKLTGSNGAALLAGTAYAFLPFHFAHFLIGHLNLSGLQWFPLFFWGFFDLLLISHAPGGKMTNKGYAERSEASSQEGKESQDGEVSSSIERDPHLHCAPAHVSLTLTPSRCPSGRMTEGSYVSTNLPWNPILKTGLGLGLVALTSQYYLYMSIFIAAFTWAVYVFGINRGKLGDKSFWLGWLAAGLIALPLIAIAVAPYVSLAGQGGLPDRELGVVRPYSAGLTDFLLPSTDHFLWGTWVGSHFNRDMWVEGTLYVGLVNFALAMFAWYKRRDSGLKTLLFLLMIGSALALLLAMGTDLHWNGAPVEISTPGFIQGFYTKPTIPIPLPGLLLFKFFPFYAKLRALMRFGIFVLLFVCAAAGVGAAELLKRTTPRWKFAAATGLVVLVLFDFYPGPYKVFTTVQPREVDSWLASQPGSGAVAQMPFSIAEDQQYTYYTLEHGKPYIGGFFNAFPPAQYKRIKPILMDFPNAESVQLLRELKVRWVLVDSTYYPEWEKVKSQIETYGLALETQSGGMVVFTLQVEK